MRDLSIQPNKNIHLPSSDFSPIRAQLAAKNNNESSIDQKSESCFNSIWSSLVSILSSIWNFFTGCCKYGQKETSLDETSKEKTALKSLSAMDKLKTKGLDFIKNQYEEVTEPSTNLESWFTILWLESKEEQIVLSCDPIDHSSPDSLSQAVELQSKSFEKTFSERGGDLPNSEDSPLFIKSLWIRKGSSYSTTLLSYNMMSSLGTARMYTGCLSEARATTSVWMLVPESAGSSEKLANFLTPLSKDSDGVDLKLDELEI